MKQLFIFSFFLLVPFAHAQQTSLCVQSAGNIVSGEQRQEFLEKIDALAYRLDWQKLRRVLAIDNNQYVPSKNEMQSIIDRRALYAPKDYARVAGALLLPYVMALVVASAQGDGLLDEFLIEDLEKYVCLGVILCVVGCWYKVAQRMLDKQNTYEVLCDFCEQLPN